MVIAVAAIVIAGLVTWVFLRRSRAVDTLDEKFAEVESPFYELIADGELTRAVVAIYPTEGESMWIANAALLFVDLATGQCSRPAEELTSDKRSRQISGIHPLGHTVIGLGRRSYARRIAAVPRDGPAVLQDLGAGDGLWFFEYDYHFYDPDKGCMLPFDIKGKESAVIAGEWIPGTDLLIVGEWPMDITSPKFKHVLDRHGNRKAVFPMQRGGSVSFEVGPDGFYVCEEDGITGGSITVHRVGLDGKEISRFSAPVGHVMLGWSPDGRYVLLAPTDVTTTHPWNCWILKSGRCLQIMLDVEYSENPRDADIADKAQTRADALPILLWDRETDQRTELCRAPVAAPEGVNAHWLACPVFLVTQKGVLFLVPPNAEESVRTLSYHDFADGTQTALSVQMDNPYERVWHVSVTSDVGAILMPLKGPEVIPATPAEGQDVNWDHSRLLLVRPDAGEVKTIALTGERFGGEYVLMKDRTILAIEEDDLIRYDPETDEKQVIVEDLLGTWKRLGEAMGGK